MEKSFRRTVTAIACGVLAILLLGFSLMTDIRLRALDEENRALARERDELEQSNRITQVRLLQRRPLDELERYAVEVLGMQRQQSSQVRILKDPA